MIYTIEQIQELVKPIAIRNKLPKVYIFGSYARGEATELSEVDILIDRTETELKGLFALGGLYNEFCEVIEKEVDMITTSALEGK